MKDKIRVKRVDGEFEASMITCCAVDFVGYGKTEDEAVKELKDFFEIEEELERLYE